MLRDPVGLIGSHYWQENCWTFFIGSLYVMTEREVLKSMINVGGMI